MNRILPTIGPETENYSKLKKIITFTKTLRLNGSHGNRLWHEKISKRIKDINNNVKILFDIPGVKPRTANDKKVNILKNEKICFYFKIKPPTKYKCVEITNPLPEIKRNTKFFTLSDGQYYFTLEKKNKNYVIGKSSEKFILKPKKGLNIPYSKYDNSRQINKFLKFIKKYRKVKFDALGLSFIQDAKILKKIKKKYPDYILISKIENFVGYQNAEEIVINSDCIMIDRGDLGAEIEDNNLFNAISKISLLCRKHGKSLIMATENLDSMIVRKTPTKSEIVSLGHSLSLNADKIMLSDETATSKNWSFIISWLDKFIKHNKNETQSNAIKKNFFVKKNIFWNMVKSISDIPVVLFSKKGYAFEHISSINPNIELTVFTDSSKTETKSLFRANTRIFRINTFDLSGKNNHIYKNIKLHKREIFKNSKYVLLIYISYPRKRSRANTISLVTKEDFV